MKLQQKHLRAALYTFAAYTLWVGNDIFSKLSGEALSVLQRAFINQFVAAIVLLALFSHSQGLHALKTTKPLFHIGRGILICLNILTIYCAVTYLPLANFYTLAFTTPFIIASLSVLLLKERQSLGIWAAIGAGFLGVIIAVKPTGYDPLSWPLLGVISIFAANFSFAFYAMTIKWGGEDENFAALAVYPNAISAVICFVIVMIMADWSWNPIAVFYMSLTGLFYAIAIIFITKAYQLVSNAFVAPFHYTQIVTGGLAGFLIWHDVPTWNLVAGAVIIIASGLYIVHRGHKAETRLTETAI